MDPGRELGPAAGTGAAHVGRGRSWRPDAGHDEPDLGGEDAAVPAVFGTAVGPQLRRHGGRAEEDLPDGGRARVVQCK